MRVLAGCVTVVAMLGLGACAGSAPDTPQAPSTTTPPASSAEAPPASLTIERRVDAATFALSDGRTVRLAGITVEPPGTCNGDAALAQTRVTAPDDHEVRVTPTGGLDDHATPWVIMSSEYGLPGSGDIGLDLADTGNAAPYPVGVDAQYAAAIRAEAAEAKASGVGRWGSQCRPADTTSTRSGPAPDVYVPGGDDDGESWFCRRRRWC